MKHKYGYYYYDQESQEKKYVPRIYTDFYCSLDEWLKLGRGKTNFMKQLRSKIVEDGLMPAEDGKRHDTANGLKLFKLSLNRTGRRDSMDGEKFSADIIKYAIKYITHKDANVDFFSWKGRIDHVEISFDNCEMPNIIVLIDAYGGSTNDTLIHCIDAIYKTLKNKASFYYEAYHKRYYNNEWDKIFNYTEDCEHYWKYDYPWDDTYRLTAKRYYDGPVKVCYK